MGGIAGSLWKSRSVGPTAESLPKSCRPSHGAWQPAPNAGFPHSHSDYGDGTRVGRKANPAKIAGSVRFLHRTHLWDIVLLGPTGTMRGIDARGWRRPEL